MSLEQNFTGPVTGLRVLDVGQILAAPTAATLLADFGADVVKVERPGTGDPLRQLGAKKDAVSLWWKANARNKRSICLDLKSDEGRTTFLRLVEQADAVVENFVAGTMEDLGIGYETLRATNPRIVMLSISGFGQTGPLSHMTAFGRTAEAFGGMAYITGFPDRPPLHAGLPVADYLSGVMGAFAVMAALYERDNKGGEGQHIDLALYETVFRLLEYLPVSYDKLGFVTERLGSYNAYVAPVGTYQTKDGAWASFTGSTQDMVVRLFEAMDVGDLTKDPRFSDAAARVDNRVALDEIIEAWMQAHTMGEVLSTFERYGVAIAPILSIADIFNDPHYQARENIVRAPDDELGTIAMPAVVPKFSRTPGRVNFAGRPLDADHNEVLRDWLNEPN